jgi:hypothetical protein
LELNRKRWVPHIWCSFIAPDVGDHEHSLFLIALNPKRFFALAVCFSDEEMQVLEKKIPWW